MIRSPLRHRSILIIDKDGKQQNDRTWGFWTNRPLLFDPVVYRSWRQLQVVGKDIYVLPFTERRALVEYTLFSEALLSREAYDQALRVYLDHVLRLDSYRILRKERGCIPVTDQPFLRRSGQHVMAIGIKGGRVKPTTGYALVRIQEDASAIVRSLCQTGHPFNVPAGLQRYRLYDSMLLQILSRHGDQVESIFTALFQNNAVERVLRFLDEIASPWENLQLIATLPPRLFLFALLQSKVRQALVRPAMETPVL
jgi:lycopene beta-cyclase